MSREIKNIGLKPREEENLEISSTGYGLESHVSHTVENKKRVQGKRK